mgnify:CR=1 FL=1
MSIEIGDYPKNVEKAVRQFWKSRKGATSKQLESGKADEGNRSAVTGGKNLDGFADLLIELVKKNGLKDAEIHSSSTTLPGYFRATKDWDLLITYQGKLIAAIELKSLCAPSVGKNLNNRVEEALGLGIDFQVAAREKAFGAGAPPFTAYLMVLEDEEQSHKVREARSPHFAADEVFQSSSYATRLEIMCERMMREQLFDSACVITSTQKSRGRFNDLSDATSMKVFLGAFAACIAKASLS